MKFAIFGSSLVAADCNGAATYVRGIVRALHARGHQVTYYEPHSVDRRSYRDICDGAWPDFVVYEPTEQAAAAALQRAADCDVLVATSGVGGLDEFLESAVLEYARRDTRVIFWDLDPAATLGRMRADWRDRFHALVGAYEAVFTYGGGPSVVQAYLRFGARACVPIHNAVDPDTHCPVADDQRLASDLEGQALPGAAARDRIVADHIFARRARTVERALERSDNVRSVRNAWA